MAVEAIARDMNGSMEIGKCDFVEKCRMSFDRRIGMYGIYINGN